MRFLGRTGIVCWWCTRQTGRLLLGAVWLVLALLLVGQLILVSSRELAVPAPLRRLVEQRLASHGLRLNFRQGTIDPSGRVLLQQVELGPAGSIEPLLTARSVYAHIDPWLLPLGVLDLKEIKVSGLDLHLPAIQSPSGLDETVVNDVDFTARPNGVQWEVSHFTGYVGTLAVTASGTLRLDPARRTRPASVTIDSVIAPYVRVLRQLQAADAKLAAFESPLLDIVLVSNEQRTTRADLTFRAAGLDLSKLDARLKGHAGALSVHTELPLENDRASLLEAQASLASLELPDNTGAQHLEAKVQGTLAPALAGLELRQLDIQVASAHRGEIAAGPLAALVTRPDLLSVQADVSLALAGACWRLQARVDPKAGAGSARLDGFVGDSVLGFAGGLLQHDFNELLGPASPAPLQATATFGPGWHLQRATGRLHSGPVRVGTVQLDETGTEFTYDGVRLLCDNLVLRQGTSLAHGRYEMDAKTKDFRFLLTGRLRPLGISGWFHEWWPNFWNTFDFSRSLPWADVDVGGRWGELAATRVFVQAEGAATGIKDAQFDRVRTRLFIRPQWFDVLFFDVLQGDHAANGSFSRAMDLEKETWRSMEFNVDSNLPLATVVGIFKADGEELLKPYAFANPPHLQLSGRVDSAAAPTGAHQYVDINLVSTGAFGYHGFPLADLSVQGRLRDDRLELPMLDVGFAGGKATGQAKVWGQPDSRRLSFDVHLTNANLGAAIKAVSAHTDRAAPETQKGLQDRLEHGRLDLVLAAEGAYADFYRFNGRGHAWISGTELAQLNLFGPLSALLRGTIFNFTSFSLDTVDAPFDLDGRNLHFDGIKVTGTSALLEANGDYDLKEQSLAFNTKVYPFDESRSLVGNAVGFVLTPFSKVLEVKLEGTLTKPSWFFAYGPSRLLKTITGTEKKAPARP